MKRVEIYIATGFEEIEAVTVIDILRRAKIDVDIISIEENLEVTGAHDVTIKCDKKLKDMITLADAIVLPGGMPGTKRLGESLVLKDRIKALLEKGGIIAAICAAPSILGTMGILENIKVSCYPGFEDMLKGAKVSQDRVVEDGNIITSRGPGTAAEFGFTLVSRLSHKEAADNLRAAMLYLSK
jgi:protein deglycase